MLPKQKPEKSLPNSLASNLMKRESFPEHAIGCSIMYKCTLFKNCDEQRNKGFSFDKDKDNFFAFTPNTLKSGTTYRARANAT